MVPLQAIRVSDQLGGKKTLAKRVSTYDGLRRAVENGLPVEAISQTLAILPETVRQGIEEELGPHDGNAVLDRAASERLERVARIIALARATYENDDEGAVSFLTTPNRNLGKDTPIRRALSDLGARQVEDLLVRIAYGFPS
ncbi:hypothetical protein BH11ARM2_BH11ARM2_16880 [soil metagenome]